MTSTNVSSVSLSDHPSSSLPWKDRTPADRLAAAQEFLRGTKPSFADLRDLAAALKDNDRRFTHARRLLVRARRHDDYKKQDERRRHKILQQLALCTYKDDDLPAERRFKRALDWLQEIATLDELKDQESLCLAGAIFKRQWETSGQIASLKQSLAFYRRGHEAAGPTSLVFDGYGAINAAFVSDLIALEEAKTSGPKAPAVAEFELNANELRTQIVTLLPSKALTADPESAWWLWVTIAEAHLGLLHYDAATEALKKALELPNMYAWQRESTARQLAYLAHVIAARNEADSQPAFEVIQKGFSLSSEAREAICLGRIGLALSAAGSARRCSTSACSAPRRARSPAARRGDSCVSGGSIIGAYYYLELRSRMLELTDLEMTQDEYHRHRQAGRKRFLEGVQTGPAQLDRDRPVVGPPDDLRPALFAVDAHGDLYQSRLFDKVPLPSTAPGNPAPARPEWISDLPFVPKGSTEKQFNPKSHNWTRGSKVPMLVLNATTLNTGHNWQFTATWMGEAATTIDNRIDSNDYLRRMYYSEAPAAYKKGVRLGHAVAASACVPGLFPALKLPKLYEQRPVVRLVDGGVHDNQGIAALLDQDCSVDPRQRCQRPDAQRREPAGRRVRRSGARELSPAGAGAAGAVPRARRPQAQRRAARADVGAPARRARARRD